jgi:hypothetical protein
MLMTDAINAPTRIINGDFMRFSLRVGLGPFRRNLPPVR